MRVLVSRDYQDYGYFSEMYLFVVIGYYFLKYSFEYKGEFHKKLYIPYSLFSLFNLRLKIH